MEPKATGAHGQVGKSGADAERAGKACQLKILDLFSGIGGFSLGLERAGMRTVAFCEIEPFCRRVLRKHWPEVPIYDDVKALTGDALSRDGIAIDLICGGFPCQDISCAGKGAGLAGERSGLWREFARLIGEIRPRFVIVENVSALLGRGMGVVLGDLSALGYDAEWHCIPAAYVGAPHRRDRVWIVAYARGEQYEACCAAIEWPGAEGFRQAIMADADQQRAQVSPTRQLPAVQVSGGDGQVREMADARWLQAERWRPDFRASSQCDWWLTEPDVGRVAHGVLARVDRLRGLGNAVVPQVVELIGRAIVSNLDEVTGFEPTCHNSSQSVTG